jgi:tetratricopeptide (TPR) repeat protein
VAGNISETDELRAAAKSLADIGDFGKARDAIGKAIERAPNDAELHALMSWYTYKNKALDVNERDRLCQHHLAVSFEIAPNNPHAHFAQGRIWDDQGNSARARVAFDAALKARPDFRAAREALDKLGSGPAAPAAAPVAPVAHRRPKVRGLVVAAVVMALLAAGGGYYTMGAQDRDLAAMAKDLGMHLPLRSASKSAKALYLDVGPSWDGVSAAERQQEMAAIADGAGKLGFTEVYVYAGGARVAESHDGKPCADQACLPQPTVVKTP